MQKIITSIRKNKDVDYMAGIGILVILIYIALIVLGIYLVITAIRFFRDKTQNDRELLKKMDELIRLLNEKLDNTR